MKDIYFDVNYRIASIEAMITLLGGTRTKYPRSVLNDMNKMLCDELEIDALLLKRCRTDIIDGNSVERIRIPIDDQRDRECLISDQDQEHFLSDRADRIRDMQSQT
jgi:hypothetical protein